MESIQGMMHTCICRTSATAAAMTTRRRRGSRRGDKGSASDTSESQKEQEFRSAIRCAKQGDLGPLRQLAIAEGFGEYGRLHRTAWARLVNKEISNVNDDWLQSLLEHANEKHKDSTIVECDVERALWHLLPGEQGQQSLERRRKILRKIINSVVSSSQGKLFYYQGYHDIASVILLTMNSTTASLQILHHVSYHLLADFMEPTIDKALAMLDLLPPLLSEMCPAISALLEKFEIHNTFALGWILTWFAHDIFDIKLARHVFDSILAVHCKYFPVYVAAAALTNNKDRVLDYVDEMGDALESPDLYQFLKSHQPLKTKESTTQVMAIAYKWHSKILVPSKLMALRDKRLKSRSREGEIALSRLPELRTGLFMAVGVATAFALQFTLRHVLSQDL